MTAKTFRPVSAWAALIAGLMATPAAAQCPTCGPSPVIAQGCSTCSAPPPPCQVMTPIVQPCYQTVPVTEYRPEKRTVQRQVCDVEYVDQPITAYRPITETKTADVPTVTWQTVTEYKTTQRDMGHWVTNYECRPKVAPCAYDSRPGVAGWWNRTTYSMRTAFEPTMVARRTWCPNVVTQSCPVARQVPQYGTRQVSYNCTRMEPYQTSRKVAVQKTRYVAEEISVMTPVTVMREVPIGTSVAWAVSSPCGVPGSGGGSLNALAPTPDGRFAERPYDDGYRRDGRDSRGSDKFRASPRDKGAFDSDPAAPLPSDPIPKKISNPSLRPEVDSNRSLEARGPAAGADENVTYGPEMSIPTVAKVSGWTSRSKRLAAKPVAGPVLTTNDAVAKSAP